jgi:O-antigen/teichoic acid export membrane protein
VNNLKTKFLYQLAVSFLFSAAPVVVFPYISRVLGPENIGKINFIDYTAQFFILFAAFGMPLYAVREISKVRDQKEKLRQLASEFVLIHFIFSILSLLGFICLIPFLPEDFREKELLILAACNILLNSFSLEWLLQGLEDFSFYGKRSFIIKLASIASVFVFVHESDDYILYYFLLIIANIAILFTDIGYAYKRGIKFKYSSNLRRHIGPLFIFFLTSATISLYTYFDTVILGLISGSLAVGFYTTGLKTIRLTQNFVNDIGGVLMPRMSYLRATADSAEINRIMNISLQYILTVSIPLGVFIFLMASDIITVLAGKAFLFSIPVLQILSLLPLLIGLSNLFGTQVLLAFGKEKKVLTGVIVGSIASIVTNLALCPLYREQGAAMACVIAEILVTVVLGLQALRLVHFHLPKKFLFGVFISTGIFVPVILLLKQMPFHPMINILVTGFACSGAYLLLQLLLFKNEVVKSVLQFFVSKVFKPKAA